MKILSITAGAAGMYCGSCFRDNALAIELMARGHDVTLVPVYTPTRTDEENVSRRDVLFGGISVYLQQHSSLFRRLPRLLDRLWDSPRVIGAFAGRGVSADARLLGELTISMLQGESGVLRKEFDKLVDWTRDEPVPDVINLPNSLLISMAAPLKRALNRPVCVTLQGEELFINGLVPPYREQALELDPAAGPRRRPLHRGQRLLRAVHDDVPRDSRRSHRGRPAGDQHGRLRAAARGATALREPRSASGYFARVAPEKGLHLLADAYVRLRQRMGGAPARLEVAGYMAPSIARISTSARAVLSRAGLQDEMTYRGEVDRAGKLAFLREPGRAVGAGDLRRAERDVPARGDGQRRAGGAATARRVHRGRRARPAAARWSSPTIPRRLPRGLHALWADPRMRERLGESAFDGVRAHYTIAQSADRLIAVYESLASSAVEDWRRRASPDAERLECRQAYPTPRGPLTVLSDVTFSLAPGEAAAITGPSGSGKSSLLYILGALEPPSSGEITLGGQNPFTLPARGLADFRNGQIGFVFQDHCLLPQCTVLENVLVPTLVRVDNGQRRWAACADAARAGRPSPRLDHRPGELSGGEKQRVAIARALIRRPRLVLCDEPTGNLDQARRPAVASLLLDLHKTQQNILIVVTHSERLAAQFPIRFDLADGKLQRSSETGVDCADVVLACAARPPDASTSSSGPIPTKPRAIPTATFVTRWCRRPGGTERRGRTRRARRRTDTHARRTLISLVSLTAGDSVTEAGFMSSCAAQSSASASTTAGSSSACPRWRWSARCPAARRVSDSSPSRCCATSASAASPSRRSTSSRRLSARSSASASAGSSTASAAASC